MAALKLAIPTKQSTTKPAPKETGDVASIGPAGKQGPGLTKKDALQVASGTRSATHARRAALGITSPLSGKLTQTKETADQRLTNQNVKFIKSLPKSKQIALDIKRGVQSVAHTAAGNKAVAKTRSDSILSTLTNSPAGMVSKKLGLPDIVGGIDRVILGTIGNTAERAVDTVKKVPGDLLHGRFLKAGKDATQLPADLIHAAKDEMLPGAVGFAGGVAHAGTDLASGHPVKAAKDVGKLGKEVGKSTSEQFGGLFRGDPHAYQKQRAKYQKGEGGVDTLSILPVPAKLLGLGIGKAGRTLGVKAATKERPNVMMAGESSPRPQPLSQNAFTIARQRLTDAARAKNATIKPNTKHGKRPIIAAAESHPNTVPTVTSVRAPKLSGQKVTKTVARLYSSAVIQAQHLVNQEINNKKTGLVGAVKDLPLSHRRGVAAGMAMGIHEGTSEVDARQAITNYIHKTTEARNTRLSKAEKSMERALKTNSQVRIRNAKSRLDHAKSAIPDSVNVVQHLQEMLAHPQGVKGGHFPAGTDAIIKSEIKRSQRIAARSMGTNQARLSAAKFQEHMLGVTSLPRQAELNAKAARQATRAQETARRQAAKKVAAAQRSLNIKKIVEGKQQGRAEVLSGQYDRKFFAKHPQYMEAARAMSATRREVTSSWKNLHNTILEEKTMLGKPGPKTAEAQARYQAAQDAHETTSQVFKDTKQHIIDQQTLAPMPGGKRVLGRRPTGVLSNLERKASTVQQAEGVLAKRRAALEAIPKGAVKPTPTRTVDEHIAHINELAQVNGLKPGGYLSAMSHPDEVTREAGGVNAAQIPKAEPKASTGSNIAHGRVYLDPLTNARALASDLRHSARGRVEETLRLQNRMTDYISLNGEHVHLGEEGFSTSSDANRAIEDAGLDHTQVTPFAHRQWVDGKQVTTWHIINADAAESIRKVFNPTNNKVLNVVRAVLTGLPSVAILATSPGWLPAQIAANVIQVAASSPEAFLHLRENLKLYKEGSTEAQAVMDSMGGHGFSFDRISHPDNFIKARDEYTALDKFWQHSITQFARRRASDPVGLFWADQHQNGFFRRLVVTNELRKRLEHMDGLAADINDLHGRMEEFTRKLDIGANIHRSPETAAADYLQVVKHGEAIAEKVRKWLGDYTAYTPAERAYLKNNVMFYGYLRHSIRTVVYTLGVQHPAVGSIMLALGGLHSQEVKDLLGQDATPQMIAKYYLDSSGTAAFDLRRSAILLNSLTDFTSGKPTQVLNTFSPLLGAIVQSAFGIDSFTGKKLKITDEVTGLRRDAEAQDFMKIFSSKLVNTVSAARVIDKYVNPKTKIDYKNHSVLVKTDESDIINPTYSKVIKPAEQLSRIVDLRNTPKTSFLQKVSEETLPFTKHGLTDKAIVQHTDEGKLKTKITRIISGMSHLTPNEVAGIKSYVHSTPGFASMSPMDKLNVVESALKKVHGQ